MGRSPIFCVISYDKCEKVSFNAVFFRESTYTELSAKR